MKLSSLIEKLNYLTITANKNTEISTICYDSRKCINGSLFVAIKGFETDGHKYIPTAVNNGCSVVVCETKPELDIPYILVEDSRLALAILANAYYDYPSSKMKVIGITGTSGKTSCTTLIKHIIEDITNDKVGLIGTNGNFIGNEEFHTEHTTPESLELQELLDKMYLENCKYVVMEVSSHALELKRVIGIQYSVAAFTNLSQDHLDFHKDMDDYARAKSLLFSSCNKASINIDDKYSELICKSAKCEYVTFSIITKDADFYADNIELLSNKIEFKLHCYNSDEHVVLNIPGNFNVYNSLTVISVSTLLGFDLKSVIESLATSKCVKGRMEPVPTDGNYSIIIDYSHKPDALEKVLKTLKPITKGRLICLFGCGGDRDKIKRPIMGKIAADNSDFVIVTSDNPRTENPDDIINEILEGMKNVSTPYTVISNRVEAIRWAVDNVLDGDVILLAGKGHEDYQVIGHDKIHMDEREIVSDIMKERAE